MDVTMENFWRQLPRIMLSIATSQFVAIDLEMTGIADKGSERHENPDVHQIYETAKKIASTFNVFDLGITCIMVQSDGSYDVESYSFAVSPYLHADTRDDETFIQDVDRRLCIAYDTLKFLRKESVRIEKIYEDCVPYLSREDVRKATQRMEKRMERLNDLEQHPYDEDDEGLSFFSVYVGDTINDWLEVLVPHMRCRIWNYGATVFIYPVDNEKDNEKRKSLRDRLSTSQSKCSGIRLVIEALVGGNFAELIDADRVVDALSACPGDAQTFCEKVCLMVQPTPSTRDENDDNEGQNIHVTPHSTNCHVDHRPAFSLPRQAASSSGWPPSASETPGLDRTKQNVNTSPHDWGSWSSQGEDYASGNHGYCCSSHKASINWEEVCIGDEELPAESLSDGVVQAFRMIEDRLKKSRPVIVGHNQFMDLLFLYNTFFDDLPDTLDGFLAEIHVLFPCVIDTKLLAIKDQRIEGEDPLLDLYNRLSNRNTMPQITWHTAYGYGRSGTAHQAGLDSYMTATVFLRLAYKLACKNLAVDKDEKAGRKLRALYSREWLSAIGRDPDHFKDQRTSSSSWSEPSDVDNAGVSQPEWGDPAFDSIRNTIRIAPHKTVCLEEGGLAKHVKLAVQNAVV
ncbi:ribonuclease CAF1 [Colletotrichum eremochloae]|nr:ribonuclease CAF1 [Colletotrichum eremochloae]